MSDDDRSEWPYKGGKIPPDDAELFDELTDHGEASYIFRDVVKRYNESHGYDRRTTYDARIEYLKEKLQVAEGKIQKWKDEVRDIKEEIELVRERRESVLTQQEEFEIALETVETPFREGEFGHIDPGHPRIQELAEKYGRQPDAVHQELRDRNPDVPDRAFREFRSVTSLGGPFEGLPGDQPSLPLDEREPLD